MNGTIIFDKMNVLHQTKSNITCTDYIVPDNVTWMSCRLVSSVTEGLVIEKLVPSQGSRRVFRMSTPAYCPPDLQRQTNNSSYKYV